MAELLVDPLARYDFRDSLGHPLANCQEYQELLEELERLRKQEQKPVSTRASPADANRDDYPEGSLS